MAARRVIKPINWAALAERVPEVEKSSYAAFKAKSDQYFRRVQENPESLPKIDWAWYKSRIAVPGMVDKFQKEYESLKIDYPVDKYTAQIEPFEKKVHAAIQQFITESNARIDKNEQEIKKLEGMLKYSEMTMEDFADAHPEQALDSINRPTIFPHWDEFQPNENDEHDKAAHAH